MKLRSLSFLLLFSMLTQIFSSLIIVVHYELNKKYITEQFCVNRDKPRMHCEGRCHLKKQLQDENNREQSPVNLRPRHDVQLYFRDISTLIDLNSGKAYKIQSYYKYSESQFNPGSVFRPPES